MKFTCQSHFLVNVIASFFVNRLCSLMHITFELFSIVNYASYPQVYLRMLCCNATIFLYNYILYSVKPTLFTLVLPTENLVLMQLSRMD